MLLKHGSRIATGLNWLSALLCCGLAHAQNAGLAVMTAPDLPELPAASMTAPHFGLDGQKVELGYGGRLRVWDARIDQYLHAAPSVTLNYGTLLTDQLAAGAALHRENNYSDLWVNSVFAPVRDLRLHVSAGQLRTSVDSTSITDNQDAILQNSYLLGAQHYWAGGLLSDVGVSTYAVQASADGRAPPGSSDIAPGRQQGNVLNLSLQPLPGSRVELWRETRELSYYYGGATQDRQYLVSNRIHFSQRLDDCLRLQGGYSTNQQVNQLDLKVARDKWFISVSRSRDGSNNDMSFGIGYQLPLGGSRPDSGKCQAQPSGSPGFGAIVDASVRRPDQFPTSPLTAYVGND